MLVLSNTPAALKQAQRSAAHYQHWTGVLIASSSKLHFPLKSQPHLRPRTAKQSASFRMQAFGAIVLRVALFEAPLLVCLFVCFVRQKLSTLQQVRPQI